MTEDASKRANINVDLQTRIVRVSSNLLVFHTSSYLTHNSICSCFNSHSHSLEECILSDLLGHSSTRWAKEETMSLFEIKPPGLHVIPSVMVFSEHHLYFWDHKAVECPWFLKSDYFCTWVGRDFYFCQKNLKSKELLWKLLRTLYARWSLLEPGNRTSCKITRWDFSVISGWDAKAEHNWRQKPPHSMKRSYTNSRAC